MKFEFLLGSKSQDQIGLIEFRFKDQMLRLQILEMDEDKLNKQ